jgi:hypothetical protein
VWERTRCAAIEPEFDLEMDSDQTEDRDSHGRADLPDEPEPAAAASAAPHAADAADSSGVCPETPRPALRAGPPSPAGGGGGVPSFSFDVPCHAGGIANKVDSALVTSYVCAKADSFVQPRAASSMKLHAAKSTPLPS